MITRPELSRWIQLYEHREACKDIVKAYQDTVDAELSMGAFQEEVDLYTKEMKEIYANMSDDDQDDALLYRLKRA